MNNATFQKSLPYIGGLMRILTIASIALIGISLVTSWFPLKAIGDIPLSQLTLGSVSNDLVTVFLIFLLLRVCFKWLFLEKEERKYTDQEWVAIGLGILILGAGLLWWLSYEDSKAAARNSAAASCDALKSQLQDQVDQFNSAQIPIHSCDAGGCGDYVVGQSLDQVFYSSRLQKCIEVTSVETLFETSTSTQTYYEEYVFKDPSTGESMDSVKTIKNSAPIGDPGALTQKIGYYK